MNPDKARAWGDKKTEGSCDIMAPRSHNRKFKKQPSIPQVYNLAKKQTNY